MRYLKGSLFKLFTGVVVVAIIMSSTSISLASGQRYTLSSTSEAMEANAYYTVVRTDPAAPTLTIGQIANVNIRIDNVTGLAGAEIHMRYDPAILEVQDADLGQSGTQIAPGTLLRSDFIAQNNVDPYYGQIDFSVLQLPPNSPVSGSGVLATITFRAKAAGTSSLSFNLVNLADGNSLPIAASVQHGQVSVGGWVAPTPVPPYYPTPVPPYYPTPVPSQPSGILGYHTVRSGESLYCIGRAYSVSPWAIASQNGLSYPYALWVGQVLAIPNVPWTNITSGPVCQRQFDAWAPPPLPAPTPTPVPAPASGTWYQVQYYDTLDSIAARFNTTAYAIMQANNLSSAYSIYVGQWLFIPASSYYTPPASGTWYQVQYYDTLDSIAARFNTTAYAIMQANNLSSAYDIYIGQWLFIPASSYYTPLPPLPGPSPSEAWLGQYFNNIDLGGSPEVQRLDPAIDFGWGTSSPVPGQIDKNFFSVRWTRNVYFEAGTYRFSAWVDDGVRIYVDNLVVVNEWHDANGVVFFDDVTLAAGIHEVKVEYYEHSYDAMISVWWERLR